MRRMRTLVAATGAAVLGFAVLAAAAEAAPITETFAFTASGFGAGAPFATVSGDATLTFDPAVSQSTSPVDAFSSNLPASYEPVSFTYFSGPGGGPLVFGNGCNGFGCGVSRGSDQFYVSFDVDAAGMPNGSSASLVYSMTGAAIFPASSVTVTTVTPVPEPASLALLIAAVIGLPLIRRRRAARLTPPPACGRPPPGAATA